MQIIDRTRGLTFNNVRNEKSAEQIIATCIPDTAIACARPSALNAEIVSLSNPDLSLRTSAQIVDAVSVLHTSYSLS